MSPKPSPRERARVSKPAGNADNKVSSAPPISKPPASKRAPVSGWRAMLRSARDLVLVLASFAVVIAFLLPEPKRGQASGSALPSAALPSSSAPKSRARAAISGAIPAGAVSALASPATDLTSASCDVRDQGLGDFERTRISEGPDVYTTPRALRPDGSYDLVLHFHGGRAAARVLCPTGPSLVLATIDRGDSSGDYVGTLRDRRAFDELITAIDREVSTRTGREAHASHLALSSFSAGYGATREALALLRDDPLLGGVLLFDSLYASYKPGGVEVDLDALEPFEAAARRALMETHFTFALTHSEVPTYGYASTGEVATALLSSMVVRASIVPNSAERGLHRVAEEGGFVLRGYGGSDRDAHCAHLSLIPEIVEIWQSRL
ncbi:MAG: hypothetical protein U0271_36735 [Polyangiaceae bacterium]